MDQTITVFKRISKSRLIFVGMLLFFALAFTSVLTMSMSHNSEMMPGCPMVAAGDHSMCPMTAEQHLNLFQSLYTATPGNQSLLSLIVVCLGFATAFILYQWHARERLRKRRFRDHYGPGDTAKLYNFLFEMFSQGILNSKMYELQLVS